MELVSSVIQPVHCQVVGSLAHNEVMCKEVVGSKSEPSSLNLLEWAKENHEHGRSV